MEYEKLKQLAKDNDVKLPGERWENGISHDQRTEDFYNKLELFDFVFNSDYFCWKSGGDGDNGETLMYVMDMIFEFQDKNIDIK